MVLDYASIKTMYKRPIPRARGYAPRQFVSETQPGGAVRSQWVAYTSRARVPSGTPGVAGSIIDKLRSPPPVATPKRRPWTPPTEFEFIAARMSEAEREPWLKRCREWFEAHPPALALAPPQVARDVDHQLIASMYAACQNDGVPPISQRVKVYRAAGCSEEFILKAVARQKHLDSTSDARQEALDLIFAKWPAASKATKTKAKPKVIKAVKKKM